MKRRLSILLIIVICCMLSACDPISYNYFNDKAAEVVAVELINYDNPKAKVINTFISTIRVQRFNFAKTEIIGAIGEDQLDDFLLDLSKVRIWTGWVHSNSPTGISLRITYSNGDFEVASSHAENRLPFFARYNSKGKLKKYLGSFQSNKEFEELINKYFVA